MSYATIADLIKNFDEEEIIALTNLSNPDSQDIDRQNADSALAYATSEIDAYIASRYTLPLANPYPPILVGICCDIARYRLDRNQSREQVIDRYEKAVSFLKDLSNGKATLGVAAAEDNSTAIGLVDYFTNDKTFSDYSLRDY